MAGYLPSCRPRARHPCLAPCPASHLASGRFSDGGLVAEVGAAAARLSRLHTVKLSAGSILQTRRGRPSLHLERKTGSANTDDGGGGAGVRSVVIARPGVGHPSSSPNPLAQLPAFTSARVAVRPASGLRRLAGRLWPQRLERVLAESYCARPYAQAAAPRPLRGTRLLSIPSGLPSAPAASPSPSLARPHR